MAAIRVLQPNDSGYNDRFRAGFYIQEVRMSRRLALFDLDNTLLDGDSDHAWGEFLISRNLVDADAHRAENFIRHNTDPLCIGQKQKWFLLSLESDDDKVELSKTTNPEFDDWRWVNYWYPIHQVIEFKRDVYRKALQELLGPLNSYIKQQ